jgi:cell division protein FtsB
MKYWEAPGAARESKPKRSTGPRRFITSGGDLSRHPFLRTFYQHHAEISDGLQRFLFFVAIATLLYAFVLGDAGALRIMSLKRERTQLRADVATVTYDINKLQKEIDRLKGDSFVMEKLGRELYGYVSPGDRVYRLVVPEKQKKEAGDLQEE